jgi:hypothetical protein
MKFTPQTEEELNKPFELLPDGTYDYNVVHAEDKVSQKGNDYIFLKLQIWSAEGKERIIFTNLAFIKLLKHFCDVNGLQDRYQYGNVPACDCLHKCGGQVIIGREADKQKPGEFKNVVKDYVQKLKSTVHTINPLDDALPF